MKFTLDYISNGEIKFTIQDAVTMTATYELEYSHSEGESNIDPCRDSYMEYFELELSDEILLDLGDTEEYRSWTPTKDVYNFIRKVVQDYNFDVQII